MKEVDKNIEVENTDKKLIISDVIKSVCCECGDDNPIYIANGKPYCLSCKPF
jgi:hypothetical protein